MEPNNYNYEETVEAYKEIVADDKLLEDKDTKNSNQYTDNNNQVVPLDEQWTPQENRDFAGSPSTRPNPHFHDLCSGKK